MQENQEIQAAEMKLVKGCLKGDPSAQRQLYRQYAPKMLSVCLRYARSREEAEDVMQEGFITVFEKLGSFRGEGSFEGWIRRIMVNKAITQFRKNALMYPVTDITDTDATFAAEEEILSNMAARDLLELIMELPPVYKMVFNLYVFEGMMHQEIAQELGISVGTSKSNLFDARKILKKKIEVRMQTARANNA